MSDAAPSPPGRHTPLTTGLELCLDFVNTVDWRDEETRRYDRLAAPADLVRWAHEAGVIGAAGATRLRRLARARPHAARSALREARALRETLHAALVVAADDLAVPPPLLARLDPWIGRAFGRARLSRRAGRYVPAWPSAPADLRRLLDPVAASAAALLASAALPRLRVCAAGGCGWLFLDHSRNGSRRWCDMRSCGNRAKVRRFRAARRSHAPRRTGRVATSRARRARREA